MNVHARHLEAGPQATHDPSQALTRVLERLPEDICAGFTQEQLAALNDALDADSPARHPINLRLTLFGLAYLVILGGRERRSRARRAVERKQHPLHTPGNIAFMAGVATVGLTLGYALRTLVFEG